MRSGRLSLLQGSFQSFPLIQLQAMVRVGRRESDGDVASRPALKWRVGRRSAVSRTAQSGKSDGAEWRVDRRSSAESAGDMMLHGSKQPKLAK